MAIQKIPNTLIADNAVTAAKIANGTLTADDIAANSITGAKISATTSLNLAGLNTTGNVGIGTTSPSEKLHVNGALQLENNLILNENTPAIVSNSGDLRTFVGGSERMRIDSSGNVVVGHTAALGSTTNRGNITINGSSDALLALGNGGSLKGYILQDSGGMTVYSDGATYQRFYTNGSERMRINSSGNVLVGGTSAEAANSTTLYNSGQIVARSSSSTILELRTDNASDKIISFRNNAQQIGSININSSTLQVGTGNTQLAFSDVDDAFFVRNEAGANRDNSHDLGKSNVRFKDLYLSGRASVGHVVPNTAGTYSVNHLGVYSDGITVNAATNEEGWLMVGGYGKLKWTSAGVMLNGTTYEPDKPHWYGSVTNTGGSGVANYGYEFGSMSNGNITGSVVSGQFRLIAPHGGLFLLTFCTICDSNSNTRRDTTIRVNGNSITNQLSETNTSGFSYRGASVVVKLSASDYLTFTNDDWYNPTATGFEAWRTVSMTMIG